MMGVEIKAFLIGVALAAVLEVYDRLVPRPFPCAECSFYFPGCMRDCGQLRRYKRLLGKQAATRAFFRRIWRRLGLGRKRRAQ